MLRSRNNNCLQDSSSMKDSCYHFCCYFFQFKSGTNTDWRTWHKLWLFTFKKTIHQTIALAVKRLLLNYCSWWMCLNLELERNLISAVCEQPRNHHLHLLQAHVFFFIRPWFNTWEIMRKTIFGNICHHWIICDGNTR